ncbi:MAG TPA: type II toxin-antitoxin system RelE/ParE family toxin [Stellaceae bacterium]|nr:type II toxin-antitoxin system RelE/ParE family toxin [Stellaceae bacterium]
MPPPVVSPRALLDLEEIGDYISRHDPVRAESFIDEVRAHFLRIAENPTAYVRCNDIAHGARMAMHGRRYRIMFRSDVDGVEIMRILHSARRS